MQFNLIFLSSLPLILSMSLKQPIIDKNNNNLESTNSEFQQPIPQAFFALDNSHFKNMANSNQIKNKLSAAPTKLKYNFNLPHLKRRQNHLKKEKKRRIELLIGEKREKKLGDES
ncbi:hypothetical protein K502DRAFT_347570 [Neoconidiobolus thromboides FSU 785]|nr:hypothetical protein K502DRAFT_347570 [Neoconidiobolus thromboides FSU 785]